MTSEPAADPSTSPPPARVRGNRWTAIEVSDVGELDAAATVSVVISGPDPDERLSLTLAALAAQTYPGSLMDVVVAAELRGDEGQLREVAGDLELTFLPSQGGGAFPRAADAAGGDLLLLLPVGAMPGRELVEAHARWHHAVGDAVSVGISHAIDARSLRASDVSRSQREGELEELLSPGLRPGRSDEEAVEVFLERTRDLTERRPDIFRLAARGSAAMRTDTFRAAGGGGHVAEEGLARLDLAYRLECLGCVFVPDRRARSFDHYPYGGPALQGAAGDLLEDADGEKSLPDPRVADLIPAAGFRSRDSSRMHTRPAMVVNVAVEDEGADEILETVDAVLRGHFQDLELRLVAGEEHPERGLIEAACAADPRIVLGPPSAGDASSRGDLSSVGDLSSPGDSSPVAGRSPVQGPSLAAYQVTLPAIAVPDERTFEDIHELMTQDGMGALHVTVPGETASRAMVEAVATGPLARARRVAAVDGEEVEVVLGRLFGERWVSGVEVSIRRRGAPEPQVTEHGPLAPATDLRHERIQHLRFSSRASSNQAKAERYAQRAERERLKARAERERAERLEARIARTESSRAYALLRPVRRLGGMARARLRR